MNNKQPPPKKMTQTQRELQWKRNSAAIQRSDISSLGPLSDAIGKFAARKRKEKAMSSNRPITKQTYQKAIDCTTDLMVAIVADAMMPPNVTEAVSNDPMRDNLIRSFKDLKKAMKELLED